ncbi:quinol:electron acceptor oxidoreductase subunit ActD [Maioricimonas rarisocia]|uniref:quinol:electron acceptor oxidoreductase subunit ActD n=1 Tax=Maioricimonas rarisocia TaxID=2528026 RepID=UPI0011A07810|nr:quinol:electron acceptor oxidoreductase subunit ActD [Maioricimonas rarisocia]
MSATLLEPETTQQDVSDESSGSVCGVLAEFAGPKQLLRAAEMVRDAGYRKTDAFSPFPIHGMDDALGIKPTILPVIVLVVGLTGCAGGLLMQWWMNAVDYPFLISGKPLFSLPANIPVTFEIIVLTSAFATFLGMLGLNGLPKPASPLLEQERFRGVTDNKFFLYVDAADPKFEEQDVVDLFHRAGATWVDDVPNSKSSAKIPGAIKMGLVALLALALVPPAMIYRARHTTSEKPRIDFFSDMDSQARPSAQQSTDLFADGRAMRPQIAGTIAVGDFYEDDAFFLGYIPGDEDENGETVAAAESATDAAPGAPAAAAVNEPNYVSEFPVEVTESLMYRGQMQFNIYCAPCHGLAGQGDGLVSLRAMELQQPTWVPPTNLTSPPVIAQPVGKIYDTITNGRRKMSGYAAQIPPEDRWAIVLYVRALQKSQRATLDEIPEDKAAVLKNQK